MLQFALLYVLLDSSGHHSLAINNFSVGMFRLCYAAGISETHYKWLFSFSAVSTLLSLLSWAYMGASGIRSVRSSVSRWWREEAARLKGGFSCTSSLYCSLILHILWHIWDSAFRWIKMDAHSCSQRMGHLFFHAHWLLLLFAVCPWYPWKVSIRRTVMIFLKKQFMHGLRYFFTVFQVCVKKHK